jgi:hypothetical protein
LNWGGAASITPAFAQKASMYSLQSRYRVGYAIFTFLGKIRATTSYSLLITGSVISTFFLRNSRIVRT